MDPSLTVWLATLAGIALLIVLDFVTVSRNPHEVEFREAASWSVFYIAVAVLFGLGVWFFAGAQYGGEYFAGYLVEKSLSVDNLFVFLIILTRFTVPAIYHQKVLLFGVVFALVLRGIFIAVGAAALAYFSFTFVLFGLLLIWTAFSLLRHRNEDPDPGDGLLYRVARRRLPFTEDYHGSRSVVRVEGRTTFTPLFLVMVAIASTDILFALDSIPAVFGVTDEAYLVFAANAFALLGLRALFFLLGGLLDRLVYLAVGLAVILGFIGVKLIVTYLHEVNPDIPKIATSVSLVVILVVLTITTVASLVKVHRDPETPFHAGDVRLRDKQERPEEH